VRFRLVPSLTPVPEPRGSSAGSPFGNQVDHTPFSSGVVVRGGDTARVRVVKRPPALSLRGDLRFRFVALVVAPLALGLLVRIDECRCRRRHSRLGRRVPGLLVILREQNHRGSGAREDTGEPITHVCPRLVSLSPLCHSQRKTQEALTQAFETRQGESTAWLRTSWVVPAMRTCAPWPWILSPDAGDQHATAGSAAATMSFWRGMLWLYFLRISGTQISKLHPSQKEKNRKWQ
jgi:hypothetical protein